jgi:16S rRNA (cytidine1402-2'-O)-methyltransferase
MGTLYIVSTPIGNLEDLTFRAARILGEVDGILAEDTRRTAILLRHLDLRTPIRSLHAHNEDERITEVLGELEEGASLALVSDAGTPLISDPGARLVERVLADGHDVVPIPGASAVLTALVASGLPAHPFTFHGFPPRKGRERTRFLEEVASTPGTSLLFESPGRAVRLLEDLLEGVGRERPVAVARELTKVHEEFRRGTLEEVLRYYREHPPRGEISIVVGPGAVDREAALRVDETAIRSLAAALLDEGRSPSRVAREVARRLDVPRNRAYELVQELARERPASPTT